MSHDDRTFAATALRLHADRWAHNARFEREHGDHQAAKTYDANAERALRIAGELEAGAR